MYGLYGHALRNHLTCYGSDLVKVGIPELD
jgi:hypothetical protein